MNLAVYTYKMFALIFNDEDDTDVDNSSDSFENLENKE
jgi:hypothetical protein